MNTSEPTELEQAFRALDPTIPTWIPPYIQDLLGQLANEQGAKKSNFVRKMIIQEVTRLTLPPDMWPGSFGPLVKGVQNFLVGYWSEHDKSRLPENVTPDGLLMGKWVRLLIDYQLAKNLSTDGGCGPGTRGSMREDGFSLIAYAADQPLDQEPTYFVQIVESHTALLRWSPRLGIEKDFEPPWK